MPIPFEYLEAAVVEQFGRCKLLAAQYLHSWSAGTGGHFEQALKFEAAGNALYREAVAFEKSLVSIAESCGSEVCNLLVPFQSDGPDLDAEERAGCETASMLTALMQMGNTSDRQAALDGFFEAMGEG